MDNDIDDNEMMIDDLSTSFGYILDTIPNYDFPSSFPSNGL